VSGRQSKVPVVFEDEHLLVVCKPRGMLSVQAPGARRENVIDLLQAARHERLHAVHRLDEDTSGVLVIARTQDARLALDEMFARHEPVRTYLALVGRMPSPPAGTIESRLAEDARGIVRSVARGGERAVTHYRALERRGPFVLLECHLETGRRNQIRAHLSELGCPIVGDRKYGYRNAAGRAFRRALLHAVRIELSHPVTGRPLTVEAPAAEPELSLPS
jgi:23S rRNA pseudouridine1911/1915/1917 synthase